MKGPFMVTVPNVPIMHAGIEYNLANGPTTFTPEDLRDAVMAANEDPSIPSPRLKIGHVDPRFNDPKKFDATPAFGRAINLRLSENGTSVYADFAGVPKWLADILPYAYPSRSVEGFWGIPSQMGRKWRFVLSACSLLGVQWPGVTVLEDLPMYYTEEIPEGVIIDDTIVEAVQAAAASQGGDMRFRRQTTASANLDDVRRAFYNEFLPDHPLANWWWIQAVLTGPNELVVEDDESGQLYKLSYESDVDGTVQFGEPTAVRIDYIPADREAQKAAAPMLAATLAIGREVLASWSDRAASLPPTTASGGAMDPQEIRRVLGLSDTASDDEVREALRALNAAAGLPVAETTEEPEPAPEPEPEPAPAPEPEEQTTPVAVAASIALPSGTVLIDEATLTELRNNGRAAAEVVRERRQERHEGLVNAAMGDGRIPPARREHWLQALAADEEGAGQVLASLAPGLIPVGERGHGQAPDEADHAQADVETVQAWTHQLFPETRVAASMGDIPQSRRIQTDGTYRRVFS